MFLQDYLDYPWPSACLNKFYNQLVNFHKSTPADICIVFNLQMNFGRIYLFILLSFFKHMNIVYPCNYLDLFIFSPLCFVIFSVPVLNNFLKIISLNCFHCILFVAIALFSVAKNRNLFSRGLVK